MGYPHKVNWSKFELCIHPERKHPKIFVKHFIQAFQRHTALNPALEHRTLLISALVENFLPDTKKADSK